MKLSKNFSFVISIILISITTCFANTYVVTNTDPDGPGSFKQAIDDDRHHDGPDTIIFQIPTSDSGYEPAGNIWRIKVNENFATLSFDSTFIDGSTQADFIGGDPNPLGPEIVIDGQGLADSWFGFDIVGDYHHIHHLVVHGFTSTLIRILGQHNKVTGCYLGVDYTGNVGIGSGHGIWIQYGIMNVIGGDTPGARNIISGAKSYNDGIYIQDGNNNQIQGNYIGLNAVGTDTVPNSEGIYISGGKHNIIGPHNVISGNLTNGIFIYTDNADSNTVFGNFIGTNPEGTLALSNGLDGIRITDGASDNMIGGELETDRNIISGNSGSGIYISDTQEEQVYGNYIGTDVDGNTAIPNEGNGIKIAHGSHHNVIGGKGVKGNVISGNLNSGINIINNGSANNIITGNKIGVTTDGISALPNHGQGVELQLDAKYNQIGPGNIIAYNAENGVTINGAGTFGNTITQNPIYGNGLQGIRFFNNANQNIEAPVITTLGSVIGTATANALVEIFSSDDHQGKIFEDTVRADGSGNFDWNGTPTGPWVTATATDAIGNTSEFSNARHLGPFTVINTSDAGEGSLRWAIDQANSSFGPDTIAFNIPQSDANYNGTVWMIQPESELPGLTDNQVILDGRTQTRNQGNTNPKGPEVRIDGSKAGNNVDGLLLESEENLVRGLIITGFSSDAISIYGNANVIQGNYLGVDEAGETVIPNSSGIYCRGNRNTIGGELRSERNIISGNTYEGLYFYSSDSNWVAGNYIGTDREGLTALPNGRNGLYFGGTCSRNRIGGQMVGHRNIISGNLGSGVLIRDTGSGNNKILGNYIGIDSTGLDSLSNQQFGVYLLNGAQNNKIGPDNVIAYNRLDGISVTGSNTTGNVITRNSIFENDNQGINLNSSGNMNLTEPVISSIDPIQGSAAPNTLIEFFSSNDGEGKVFEDSVMTDGAGNFTWSGTPAGPWLTTTARDVSGNTSEFSDPKIVNQLVVTNTHDSGAGSLRQAMLNAMGSIGPDSILFDIPESDGGFTGTVWVIQPETPFLVISDSGTAILGHSQTLSRGNSNLNGPEIMIDGSLISTDANGFTIQSSNTVICNLIISGFTNDGISIAGLNATGNRIFGNYIGTNASGTQALSNQKGVSITGNATQNTIGGFHPDERNIISGNNFSGVQIYNADQNEIYGNFIGLTKTGIDSLPNYYGIEIWYSENNRIGDPSGGNVISTNLRYGIYVYESSRNKIQGNLIGTDHTGTLKLGNGRDGIYVTNFSNENMIGGSLEGEGNLVSGNTGYGINLNTGCLHNQISGNKIGTNLDGLQAISNTSSGVNIGHLCKYNQLGPGNLISGNMSHGILLKNSTCDSNLVIGNRVGLDATGSAALPNHYHGIRLEYGARHNTIGGPASSDRNYFSGNGWSGITTIHDTTFFNIFQNNYCGTDTSGTQAVPNQFHGAHLWGTNNTYDNNIFSGNKGSGIVISNFSSGNLMINNKIGVQADGMTLLPNEEDGIQISGPATQDTIGPGNIIAYNNQYGIVLKDSTVKQITITQNSIYANDSTGIKLENGANENIARPMILGENPLTGSAPGGSTVEIFSDSWDQGRIYEATVSASAWHYSGTLKGPYVTVTVTDNHGNTSAFSDKFEITVGIDENPQQLPTEFSLSQNYPNPFNPETTIQYTVKEKCHVILRVYDILGKEAATLVNRDHAPGYYHASFIVKNLASGLYFYRIQMGGFKAVRKMVVVE